MRKSSQKIKWAILNPMNFFSFYYFTFFTARDIQSLINFISKSFLIGWLPMFAQNILQLKYKRSFWDRVKIKQKDYANWKWKIFSILIITGSIKEKKKKIGKGQKYTDTFKKKQNKKTCDSWGKIRALSYRLNQRLDQIIKKLEYDSIHPIKKQNYLLSYPKV